MIHCYSITRFSMLCSCLFYFLFFFNDTATTEIYTLSLHDALPIYTGDDIAQDQRLAQALREEAADQRGHDDDRDVGGNSHRRSEEHTSELQSRQYLVCRLLLEKKNKPELTGLYWHPPVNSATSCQS